VLRFHDLRQTAASLIFNYGIPVIVVSRRLGHVKPSLTLDVDEHLFPSLQAQAAQRIDELSHLWSYINCTQLHQEMVEG
jgi:integrase